MILGSQILAHHHSIGRLAMPESLDTPRVCHSCSLNPALCQPSPLKGPGQPNATK